jgi:two-component system chemotaxis response regulator CheB
MSRVQPIRVLVVDDSALMRKMIADMLKSAPEIEVAGTARDGDEAVAMAERLRPDVITLDVEMPGKSGLEALPQILEVCPVPVVMVSALTKEGADVTLAALELGAVDFLPKPGGPRGIAELKSCTELLVAKVLTAAQSRIRRPRPAVAPTHRPSRPVEVPRVGGQGGAACIAIGISTGGPQALSQTLPRLKPPIPPIVIVQHMPAQFTGAFAARLARQCSVAVKEAEEGDRVLPDQILVAQGGRHFVLVGKPPLVRASLTDGPPVSGHRPSIDMLFQSVARCFAASSVGILMTGMGRDGVEGCKRILAAGGSTFGQDEATSVVFGMNKAAIQEGAIRQEFALDELPDLIERLARPA